MAPVGKRCKVVKVVARERVITIHAATINSAPDTLPEASHVAATLPRIFRILRHGAAVLREELVLAEHAVEFSDLDVPGEL